MKYKSILFVVGVLSLLLLCSCEINPAVDSSPSVKQIDITVMIPFEPSSLEYFDNVVRYSDNNGLIQVDTIRKENSGIVVEDWQDGGSYEVYLTKCRTGFDNHDCYVKTYSYTSLPVSTSVTVELIPKFSKDSMVSFSFITPKPYIYPNVYFSESSIPKKSINRTLNGINVLRIDSMTIGKFMSIYGDTFTSCCQVKECNGIDTTFY
ncbi:MAG: hypothetical protein KBT33_13460 [Prevotellaceae bacterium]|nr:hypothetical protein [Candidatus Minthosoma equi]